MSGHGQGPPSSGLGMPRYLLQGFNWTTTFQVPETHDRNPHLKIQDGSKMPRIQRPLAALPVLCVQIHHLASQAFPRWHNTKGNQHSIMAFIAIPLSQALCTSHPGSLLRRSKLLRPKRHRSRRSRTNLLVRYRGQSMTQAVEVEMQTP
jgi:hypothetical protein